MSAKSPAKSQAAFTPQLPPKQVCGKCDAEFRWEPSLPGVKGAPLVARLSKPSDTCDCGYGNAPPPLEL